ncbi:nuclease activity [Pristimantis euphronides]
MQCHLAEVAAHFHTFTYRGDLATCCSRLSRRSQILKLRRCCRWHRDQPPHSSSKFYNYKKYFSIVFMAVADSQYKFVAINLGAYGSTGNSWVLLTSEIGMQILWEGRMLSAPRALSGSTPPVPYFMVSDEAFPLKPNLLRPYLRRGLDAQRRIFNFRLSWARRVV